ncbi:hypothetical protein E5198_10325 [Pseudomonas sp. A-1]|uniref:hypothetical protein n=1 Tax=Pseudomonas sp. A-1 TaxID=1821274 RepID=UPI0010A60D1B|nr:hypothetical protein [Pseudomonas sp. A-1]THG82153.1 hypothetical protein E5198_10325 [Pseudomonas sp. A-1]
MARFTMELPILGVQVTKVDDKVYAKVFVGEEPDNQTETIASIMTMPIREECADEVFAATRALQLGQMVRLHVETERGGKQSTKNVVLHIEPVQHRPVQPNQPGQVSKPAEPAKA